MEWRKEGNDYVASRFGNLGDHLSFRITRNHDLSINRGVTFHNLSKPYQLIIGWDGGVTYSLHDELKAAQQYAEGYY